MWNYRVDLEFPKIEVRFKNLTVESFVHVGSRALPTIPNFVFNMAEVEFYSFYNHFPKGPSSSYGYCFMLWF
jgi:hypothetical protein